MPKLSPDRVPAYRLHKQSGQAIVTLSGRDVLLGPYNSEESREKYNRVTAEWLANGRRLPAPPAATTVAVLAAAFWKHVQEWHPGPKGKPQRDHYKLALRVVKKLYAETPAASFGPLALRAVRDEMVRGGWARSYVNQQVGRVRRMFKWAVGREVVPAGTWQALQAVEGLRRGKTAARETAPVGPVSEGHVAATLPFVSRQVKAMAELQLVTGMRPGEVCVMRARDIDATGRPWAYRPASHKTAHHGHARTVYLGPRAQEILRPFLKPDLTAYLFSPADAEAERREELAKARKTPASCGNVPGSHRAESPKRKPGDRYTPNTYQQAIRRACAIAFPPPEHLARRKVPGYKVDRWETPAEWKARLGPEKWKELTEWREEHRWHPHQLRHTAATNLRKTYGLEAAQVILGHATLKVTEVYAEKNVEAARRIMGEVG